MMRAVVYARVSTDAQEREGTSLESQVRECERYCADRGYHLVETFRESYSGGSIDRPELTRLRELLREGSVDVLVAYAVDRLSRSQNHIGILFDDLARAGARLELVTETFEDTAVGRFIIAARGFVAEVEREKIRERTARGKRERAAAGAYMPSRVPYGYRRSAEKGVLELDEDAAPVVRDIFHRFIEGESYRGIALTLNALGVPSSQGKPWERQVIKKMLTNESYTGVLSYMDVRLDGHLPALIDPETFERVQRQIASRPPRGGGKGARSQHLLTGLLWCGECGARMHGRTHRKGTVPRVYACSRYAKGAGCEPYTVDAEAVERDVVEAVEAIYADYEAIHRLRTDAIDRIRADLATVQAALRKNDRERQNAITAIRAGEPFARETAEAVQADRTRLMEQQAEIESRIEQAERDREHAAQMPSEVRRLLDPALPLLTRTRILSEALAGSQAVVNRTGRLLIK